MKKQNDYAVIMASGSQYRVSEGEEFDLFGKQTKKGEVISFNKVLLVKKNGKILIGEPFVKNAKVKATVVKIYRGEKLRVATYKAKSKYRRTLGYRDDLTCVKIDSIVLEKDGKN